MKKRDPNINQSAYQTLRDHFGRKLTVQENDVLRNLSFIEQTLLAAQAVKYHVKELLSPANQSRYHHWTKDRAYMEQMDLFFYENPFMIEAKDGMSKEECYDIAKRNGVNESTLESLFGAMELAPSEFDKFGH